MSTFILLNLLSIVMMMVLCAWLAGQLSRMKYDPLDHIIQLIIHRNTVTIKWLWDNPFYIFAIIFQISLIATCLTQIGQFIKGSIFVKPIFVFTVAPILWASLYGMLRTYTHKHN